MKITKCEVHNFGSYAQLDFDFSNVGLALVYGATGSGKSTLEDIPTWILYGITSKNGSVDEVRSWTSPDAATTGTALVQLASDTIKITRIRGKASENDLYWEEQDSDKKIRGKDLSDTQKLLNQRLAVDADLYGTAACFNEFSDTALFFLAKAKDKRAVFERVADLSLPMVLAERAADERKKAKKALAETEAALSSATGAASRAASSLGSAVNFKNNWDRTQQSLIASLQAKYENFEAEEAIKVASIQDKIGSIAVFPKDYWDDNIKAKKALILELSLTTCDKCGGPTHNEDVDFYKEEVRRDENAKTQNGYRISIRDSLLADLDNLGKNVYKEQVIREVNKTNPFIAQIKQFTVEAEEAKEDAETLRLQAGELNAKFCTLLQIYDLSFELRGKLLEKAVKAAQDSTNRYLETYFDSEFRVDFALRAADGFSVDIRKNGNACVYRQLSKGQRGLLKLCFVASIMQAAANNNGQHFSTLFFDEALDGLDSALKEKAFGLFQELAKTHESVLVVEHSPEFQNLFDVRYSVQLEGDMSTIERKDG